MICWGERGRKLVGRTVRWMTFRRASSERKSMVKPGTSEEKREKKNKTTIRIGEK